MASNKRIYQQSWRADLTGSDATEALVKFCGDPWRFQQTFETPLGNLQPFVKVIVSASELAQAASLTIDEVVFEPEGLIKLLKSYSIPPKLERGFSLTASGQLEVEELLRVVLSEWIDFLFIPESQSFAVYADHDEFTTVYAHTRANLNQIAGALRNQGFKVVENYERRF